MRRIILVIFASSVTQVLAARAASPAQALTCRQPKPPDQPCYTWRCNTQDGYWEERPLALGTACNDGDPLTINDRCYTPVPGSQLRTCVGEPFESRIFNSLDKIKKDTDIVPSTAGAALYCARNEFEAFQIGIQPLKAVTDLDVSVSALAGPAGSTPLAFEIWREHHIHVATPSGPDGQTGDWPDKLIPKTDTICSAPDGGCRAMNYGAFPYSFGVGENVVAYAETFATATQVPGDYTGTVTVSWSASGFRPSITFPVRVTVWPFTLPSTSSLKSIYNMSPGALCHPDALFTGVYSAPPSPDEACIDLALRFAQLGLDHRLTVDPSVNRQPTDSTRAALFSSTFASRLGAYFEGASRPSWTKLAGAKPSRVSPYPNDNPETFLGTWLNVYSANPANQTPKWLDRSFYYVCDEPHAATACTGSWSAVVQRSDAAHQYGITTLVTTHLDAAEPALAALGRSPADVIDVITPNVVSIQAPGVSRYPIEFEQRYVAYRPPFNQGTNRELWWYQACDSAGCRDLQPNPARQGYPEYAIDVSGVKNRAMQWMTRRFGMVGELYWDTVAAFGSFGQNTVVDSALNFDNVGLYGDGTFFYPGYNRPLPSLRLKHLRDGMEDYEYLKLMADRHCARGIAKALFDHARTARDVTSETLLQYRRYVADEIMAPATWCPGVFSRECDVGWFDCAANGVCVDLGSTANCGACGSACPAGYVCYRGTCSPSTQPPSQCPAYLPVDCGCDPLVCRATPSACPSCP